MKFKKGQGNKGPKVTVKQERVEGRFQRIENEIGIGKPDWEQKGK